MLITNENIELKQCLDCKTKLKNITEHIFSLCVKKSTILDCIEKQNKDIFYLYGKEATLMEKENIKNILNNCSKCIINNTKKDKNYSFEKDLLNEDKDLNLYETFIQKNEISNIIKKEQEFKLKEKNLKEQLEKEIKIKESALEKVKEVKNKYQKYSIAK